MLRVIACVTEQHDIRLVVLAGLVCLMACFTALSLFGRAEAATGRPRWLWLTAAGVVFGSGVWTTHFVAMLAFRPNLPIGYDIGLTALSVLTAIAISCLGLWLALNRSRLTVVGGAVVGASVGAMHYVGMAAMRVPAEVRWDAVYVVASVAIGIVLGAAALWTARRGSTLRNHMMGASLLGLGICALHFTAMAAATLVPDPRIPLPDQIIAPASLAVAVAAVTIIIIALGLVGAIIDRHLAERTAGEAARLRAHVAELETMHRELRAATEKLMRSERLSALGQVAGTVSHELRNPLASIKNSMMLVRQRTAGKDLGIQQALDRIDRNVERCTRIAGDLLEYARAKDITREPTAIDAWLGEMLDEHAVPGGMPVARDFRSSSDVAIDGERFRQVIINLVDNAAQALIDQAWQAPQGHQPLITVRTEAAGPHVMLSVIDNGPGIAADKLDKIFEPLFTTKSSGVGLGLPTVRQLVEKHGGTIEVESAPGEGATFVIRVPRCGSGLSHVSVATATEQAA